MSGNIITGKRIGDRFSHLLPVRNILFSMTEMVPLCLTTEAFSVVLAQRLGSIFFLVIK